MRVRKWLAVGLLCAGVAGVVFFAGAIALHFIERQREEDYYASLSAMFAAPETADTISDDTANASDAPASR